MEMKTHSQKQKQNIQEKRQQSDVSVQKDN